MILYIIMNLQCGIILVIIILTVVCFAEHNRIENMQFVPSPPVVYSSTYPSTNNESCQGKAFRKSQVPTLNMQGCFNNRFYECNPYNGSYCQCTNNYLPSPNTGNCQCENRTFEMCPAPYKISEDKYYKTQSKCLYKKNILPKKSIDFIIKNKPRVNAWQYVDKDDDFLVQCN
jgi:hypothetical protein